VSSSWVIDSSVGFAWIHDRQATPETNKLLEEVEAGATLVVPVVWFAEVANSLMSLQRRKKLTSEERKKALETLARMNFTVDEEAGHAAFGKTSDIAEKYDLTIHDATYLELALRRGLPLASRDSALVAAARKAGLKVLPNVS
jgi:predicted nucleic acid-binding protein